MLICVVIHDAVYSSQPNYLGQCLAIQVTFEICYTFQGCLMLLSAHIQSVLYEHLMAP